MRGPLMSAIRADYFGSRAFGTITGLSSMVVMFGMMGGPLIAGVLADRTGSYEVGFRLLAALAAVGSIFFALARKPRNTRREASPTFRTFPQESSAPAQPALERVTPKRM